MHAPSPLARLMTLAFHFNLAMAAAMVLCTAWTGYLVATGQIRPALARTTPATHAVPVRVNTPACDCHRHHRDELQVRNASAPEAS